MMKKITLSDKFSLVNEHWSPKIIAELNGQYVKIAKLLGEFDWHHHENEDELFWVIKGELTILMRDGEVKLGPGEIFVVPKGVEHKPVAEQEVELVLFEPAETRNTGEVVTERTLENLERI